MDYVRKGQAKSRNRVFIVHRLDKETSGVLVFAKNEETKRALQDRWEKSEKIYLAWVEGSPTQDSGTITSFLAENSALRVYSTPDRKKGKFAVTRYRVLKRAGPRTLLEIKLETGRKHQIRVHLADSGWPVLGDAKYGRAARGSKRLALHAKSLAFTHPKSGERLTFEAPAPASFG